MGMAASTITHGRPCLTHGLTAARVLYSQVAHKAFCFVVRPKRTCFNRQSAVRETKKSILLNLGDRHASFGTYQSNVMGHKHGTSWLTALLLGITILAFSSAKKGEEKCEVCVSVLKKAVDDLSGDDKTNPSKIAEKIREICGGLRTKENKFCFYIGALPESATSIMNEVAKFVSWSMPLEKVCQRIGERDAQICELKYDKAIDWKTVELKKLRVKELKKILDEWGEQCKACTEKTEFVKRIEELKPKYVKTEL